jgi:hypothetical protein
VPSANFTVEQVKKELTFLDPYSIPKHTGSQARISLRAGGAAAWGPARGGAEFEDLLSFFLLVLKISPAAPFSEHFLGCRFTKILLSVHFPQKFRLRRRLTFIVCSYACSGGPKKQAARGPRRP